MPYILTYKSLLVLVFFTCFQFIAKAQNREDTRIDEEFPTPISFPYDYLGTYSGNLNISDHTGTIANVPTDFTIKESEFKDVFIYEFTHLKGKQKVVNVFELHIIDEKKGFYAIKDKDSMEYLATNINNTLYSTHEIDNKIMFTSLHFTNNGRLRFDVILSTKSNKKRKLSNVVQVQKAVLSKIN